MDKKQGVPSGTTIIGKKNYDDSKQMLKEFIQYLDPIIGNFGEAIELINKRLAVVEELKKIFPDNINVTIKHEYPKISIPHTVTDKEIEDEIFEKYKSIIENKKKKEVKK